MSTIRVNNVTDELGTGAPDFPNGITIDTVTVSGKIVHTGDTDTSIGFPINDTITMDTAGTERMRIDSSGNVGIGTATPFGKLSLGLGTSTLSFGNVETDVAQIGVGSTADSIAFGRFADSGATFVERARIDSSGNVGIGTSSPSVRLDVRDSIASVSVSTDSIAYFGNEDTTSTATTRITLRSHQGDSFRERVHLEAGLEGVSGGYLGIWTRPTGSGITEKVRVTASGKLGIGTTTPDFPLDVSSTGVGSTIVSRFYVTDSTVGLLRVGNSTTGDGSTAPAFGADATSAVIYTNNTESVRIDANGYLLMGKTAPTGTDLGFFAGPTGLTAAVVGTGAGYALYANRQNDDGVLVSLRQANTQEGTISVAGTTISYNGGHLSRWAQTTGPKDDTLVKGTVLSNLDEMNAYTDADGKSVDNEQLNKVKVSDVEGDANVAGVFVNWTYDDQHNVDEINMAMTGDMVIRIGAGVTVARGDLLMSAGDGTAKPQGDDIVRSKTIAKVTSTHISHIYEDGSYCVPCVIMAC